MYKTSLRTQIILPKKLRQKIEQARLAKGESLAEYLRTAAEERLKREQKRREGLAKLAKRIVGTVKKSAWEGIDVVEWQREMRRDKR